MALTKFIIFTQRVLHLLQLLLLYPVPNLKQPGKSRFETENFVVEIN